MTLYEVLGVQPGVTPADLKSAWRALARREHPDHNPGDPGAGERLARINAAYDVLSDPERREAYDLYGEDAASAFFDEASAEPLRSSAARRPVPRAVERGEDLETEVVVDAGTAARGGGIRVMVREPVRCATCGGTGWRRAGRACGRCEAGWIPGIGPFQVLLPPGLVSGQVLVGPGVGAAGRGKGAARGDLRLTIEVPPTYLPSREGPTLTVPCPDGLMRDGGRLRVPLPDGTAARIAIRPSTRDGQRIRLRGKGTSGEDVWLVLRTVPAPTEVPIGSVGTV